MLVFVAIVRPLLEGNRPGIAVGSPAPEIAGISLDGHPVSLSALRGHPVLVNFWGPSCVPCRDEFPLFREQLESHAADGLAIIGVLMDDPPQPALPRP